MALWLLRQRQKTGLILFDKAAGEKCIVMKKVFVFLLCFCILLCGCGNGNRSFTKMKAEKQRAQIQELIKDKDEDGLFDLFSPATVDEVGESLLRSEIEELMDFCDAEDIVVKNNGHSEGSASNRGVKRVERRLSWDVTIDGEAYTIGASVIPTCTEAEEECGIYEIHVQRWSDIEENGLKVNYFEIRGINISY